MKVGQLGRLIRFFKENHVERCVMAGQIAPSNLFHLRPDGRALRFLLSLRERHAHSIFGGIARELEKDGILLIEGTSWLRASPGGDFHCGRRYPVQTVTLVCEQPAVPDWKLGS